MLRHVVLLEFDDATPDGHLDAIAEQLRELPGLIPALRRYSVGKDLELAPGNAHLAVVAEFEDIDGYLSYRDDPTHRRIIDEQILPHLRTRSAAQYWDDSTD
jgi:hypothetical protein